MNEDVLTTILMTVIPLVISVIWGASRIKATVDTHGNAIGEMKRILDAHEGALKDHHGRISRIEGERGR